MVIVGAGSIGLATALALRQSGHKVLVLERRQEGNESSGRGSGIALYPISFRHFNRLGVDDFFKKSSLNGENQVRQYSTGALLKTGRKPAGGRQSRYILRADLVDSLYSAAVRDGVQVEFGVTVIEIDEAGPSVTLADKRNIRCDLLIGANGKHLLVDAIRPNH